MKNENSTWRYQNDSVFHALVDSFVGLMRITDPVFISRDCMIDAILLADSIYQDEKMEILRQYGKG